ncbi:ATP-binding cassette domain-containing protein [Pedobacter insulae]|uniref:ABC-type lipopolysaccharide export system, ATPase component n=1 Tax=Pedobacter insulae TaxID=414048 RepID=A0A1I2WNH2_9SPHI|nr:ATP-binding cassette domain-containing protein [Pedobacter insulae]SFH02227.1 ABC-type lipopolysaccharide export system, ATPase component [Pedobacter insulae]
MSGLYVDSVNKEFGLNQILTDVFISCKIGEVIGLLGRNGAGKSTLLQIIFGALKAGHKYVKVNDKLIHTLFDSRDLIRYLPQDSFLPIHVSVKTIIAIYCTSIQAAQLHELAFIKPFLFKKSNELSGGEKRLIEIFILLYGKAKFVLLDEPFNGLAPLHIELVKEGIKAAAVNKGFIITDHDY